MPAFSFSVSGVGGGGSPAGSNTQIQYNDSGSFGASSNLTFSSGTLSVTGRLDVNTTNSLYRIYDAPQSLNILGGHTTNSIAAGVSAALIHGGGYFGSPNSIVGATSDLTTICGGYDNVITDGLASTIGGGAHHRIRTTHGTVCGGSYNLIGDVGANADYSIICGGTLNSIESDQCFIGGGANHSIAASHPNAVIVGGLNNDITGAGQYGAILGGYNNSLGASTGSTIIGTQITLSGNNTVAMGDNFTETVSNILSTRFTGGHYLQGRVVIGATSATATTQDLDIYPSSTSTGGIFISRAGTGSTNAADWGFRVRNAANTDSFRMSQSSSAYTTGGTFGWVGNSMGFIYYPTELRIGTGVGATPAVTFSSAGLTAFRGTAPTHSITIGDAGKAAAFALYNTTDQVTNTESFQINWASNVLQIQTLNTGTGTTRELRVGNASNFLRVFAPTAGTQFEFQGSSSSVVAANGAFRTGFTSTSSSGAHVFNQLAGVVNQSATAGYTLLDLAATETSTGSGTKKLIDCRVGGTSNFSILNNGRIQYVSGNTATTVGAAGGASALPATPTGYLLIDIGGTTFKLPYYAN